MTIDANNPIGPNPPLPEDSSEHDGEMRLQRYLDGRLDENERQAVSEWLKTSAAARRTLDALREEDRLLREALEVRVEPARRLGDKVIVSLHAAERERLHTARSRRWRRQIAAVLGAAASIALCFWLIQPREASGSFVSGTPAALVTPSGQKQAFTKGMALYDGDQLFTAQGQFVRVRLSGDVTLDLDERSHVTLEKNAPRTLRLEAGRAGLDGSHGRGEVLVSLPQGSVRMQPGTKLDLWLPEYTETVLPELFAPGKLSAASPAHSPRAAAAAAAPAVVTVFKGMAFVTTEQIPESFSVTDAMRCVFTAQSRQLRPVDPADSRVLDMRGAESWHALDDVSPPSRAFIGLTLPPDFVELGKRLGLTRDSLPAIEESLRQLQSAMGSGDARLRAERLASGQQALRAAYEPLSSDDDCRRFGRMLEGLAHVERGLALAAGTDVPAQPAANGAFAAASVAFEEAQQPAAVPGMKPAKTPPSWPQSLKTGGVTHVLAELPPLDQSDALAAFNHAVSEYWRARTDGLPASRELAAGAAEEFKRLEPRLGWSVEVLAARLGEALAVRLTGQAERSIQLLRQVAATPLAGTAPAASRHGEGLRQLALLELVRQHMAAGQTREAERAAAGFWLLYPLHGAAPAAREIERALEGERLLAAERALREKNCALAVQLFDELLEQSLNAGLKPEMRLNLLRALVELRNGERARAEAQKLAGEVPPNRRAEYDWLAGQAKALPAAPRSAQ